MIARPLFRVPSKPRDPQATCDRGIYVTVMWRKPKRRDHITGYVIKYGETNRFTGVEEYATLSIDGNTENFQFTHQLNEKTSYWFAVAAVNAGGQGKFSEFTNVDTGLGKLNAQVYFYHASKFRWYMR